VATEAARANTFPKLLLRNARLYAGRPAYRHKDLGIWQVWTWARVLEEVRAFSVGLREVGLKRDDKVAIIGSNRPRLYWAMCAAQALGGVPVPIYADSVAQEMDYILDHAEVTIAVVEDQEQVDKLLSIVDRLPRLALIIYDETRGLRDYEAMLEEVLARLNDDTHPIAVGLVAIPEKIRGFGHVKARHLKAAKADEATLLDQLRAGVSPLLKAAE